MAIEVPIHHEIVYNVRGRSPIQDVIASLQAIEFATRESVALLEELTPGLTIEHIETYVTRISQESPLREGIFAAIFVTFQKDLEREVPRIFTEITGRDAGINPTILTILFLLVLFYGTDYAVHLAKKLKSESRVKRQYNALVKELSDHMGVSEDLIREKIQRRYQGRKIKEVVMSALKFFRPSKNKNNAEIIVHERVIDTPTISEIPSETSMPNDLPKQ